MKDGLFGTMKEANEGAKLQWYVVDCPKLGFRNNIMLYNIFCKQFSAYFVSEST